jgi:hypothetical protein
MVGSSISFRRTLSALTKGPSVVPYKKKSSFETFSLIILEQKQ